MIRLAVRNQRELARLNALTSTRLRRIILEIDPSVVASRVSMRGADESLPLSEQVQRMRTYHFASTRSLYCGAGRGGVLLRF